MTLAERLKGISGRSIRNILKLANTLEGSKATHATIVRVSKYQALEEREKKMIFTQPCGVPISGHFEWDLVLLPIIILIPLIVIGIGIHRSDRKVTQ